MTITMTCRCRARSRLSNGPNPIAIEALGDKWWLVECFSLTTTHYTSLPFSPISQGRALPPHPPHPRRKKKGIASCSPSKGHWTENAGLRVNQSLDEKSETTFHLDTFRSRHAGAVESSVQALFARFPDWISTFWCLHAGFDSTSVSAVKSIQVARGLRFRVQALVDPAKYYKQ